MAVSIIDIGSNSVRLVVYEGLTRSPLPLFNERVLCGLGRHIASTGSLDSESIERALSTLRRFGCLSEQLGVSSIHVLATAAVRESSNGSEFVSRAEEILGGANIHVLSGREEAHYAALGIVSGFDSPSGLTADMGGGSVEFSMIDDWSDSDGATFPLGGLRLADESGGSLSKAREITKRVLDSCDLFERTTRKNFYAVGGTWRSLASLHMERSDYPLRVTHHYEIDSDDALRLCRRLTGQPLEKVRGVNRISPGRLGLLPYGAIVLERIIKRMSPSRIIFSSLGLREGYLYSLLPDAQKKLDPLVSAAEDIARVQSRSLEHAQELDSWTASALSVLGESERGDESKLRRSAAMLADITWRSHSDFRGIQTLNLLTNANYVGVDHPGRAFIALACYYRHIGVTKSSADKRNSGELEITQVVSSRLLRRAQLLGSLWRVAYPVSAARPGVLPHLHFKKLGEGYSLVVPSFLSGFSGERIDRRLSDLSALLNKRVEWRVV